MNLVLACRDVGRGVHGGLPRATCELAQALAQAGHSVRLLTEASSEPVPELPGVSLAQLQVPDAPAPLRVGAPESAPDNIRYAAAVYREVRRVHENVQPVDAVIAPLWRSEGALCILDGRFPTIVSCVTGLRVLTELDDSYRLLPDIEQRLSLERESLARARYLHGLTAAALAKTVRDYELRPDLTGVVGRGLLDRGGAATTRDSGHRPVRVLFVGRIELRKGADVLLDAASELAERRVDVSVTLAGPEHDPRIRATFERAHESNPRVLEAVRFTGALPDSERDRLLAEADLVCLPSRYESHGIALIEAMMFGKAIVTCDSGGIAEVVDAGRNALLTAPDDPVALADAIGRLAHDPVERARLGAAARLTYEQRFSATAAGRGIEQFIERVLCAHEPSAADVGVRLAALMRDVFADAHDDYDALAAALLDPAAPTLQRLRAEAARSQAPRRSRGLSPRSEVTAVLVTHDRPRLLRRALDSLEAGVIRPQVVVVDNGSGPHAARLVAAECSGRERVQLHRLPWNRGAAGGRTFGARFASGPLVLFLDDDAELLPGAIDHLVRELDEHPAAGAVTATVVRPDGHVQHSGGELEVKDGVAAFDLVGLGTPFARDALAESGPAGWVPSTALLVRRALLEEHPFDEQMAAYFEDNEWSYRVARERPSSFRRSRDALALHRLTERPVFHTGLETRLARAAACARFYERHGVLLGPWLFDTVPELRAEDGSCDLAGARLLMELISRNGPEWTLSAWQDGQLWGLLGAHRLKARLRTASAELARAHEAARSREETFAWLYERHLTLRRVEQGGWWRLRGRVLPLIRVAQRLRALTRAQPGGPAGRGTVAPARDA